MLNVDYSYCQSEQKLSVERFLNEWYTENDYIITKTSGSTGKPKEVTLSKSAMILSAQRTLDHFKIIPGATAFLIEKMVKPVSARLMLPRLELLLRIIGFVCFVATGKQNLALRV